MPRAFSDATAGIAVRETQWLVQKKTLGAQLHHPDNSMVSGAPRYQEDLGLGKKYLPAVDFIARKT